MTTSGQQIEIPISKKKLILMIIGSLIFVGLGVLFVMNPEKYTSPIMRNPTVIFIAGLASILFFGFCFPFIVKKLGDKSPGLIISDQGIFDNSSGVSAGQILWKDIDDILVIKIHRQRMIILQVNNPQDYIEKQTSNFKRKMMTINYKMYGTPLSMTSNGLKISFDELFTTLTNKLKASRQ
jgi:uncharacterized membrane protein YobD (UPF0266 family)